MTDIKVPVSAPGSSQAASDMDKAAMAAKNLADMQAAVAKGTKDFQAQIEKESAALSTKLTPALKKAREEAKVYNEQMGKGNLKGGRAFLARSETFGGEGGERERLLGRGGLVREVTHMGSRIGGPIGEAMHGMSLAAGATGLALGGVAVGALFLKEAINATLEAEKRRMDEVEKETKIRVDLNKTLREAKEGQQDRAKALFEQTDSAKRFITASSGDMAQAQGRFARIDATGDPAVYGAMKEFLKSKRGHGMGFEGGMDAADKLYGSGAFSYTEALTALQNEHGPLNLDRMIGQQFGMRRSGINAGSADRTQHGEDVLGSYNEWTGMGKAEEGSAAAGQALLNQSRDFTGLVLPAVARGLKEALDPAGVAADKFVRALNESLEPLKARAEVESRIFAELRHIFTSDGSESDKLKREKANIAAATR